MAHQTMDDDDTQRRESIKEQQELAEAIERAKDEVDMLSDKVVVLERNVHGGTKAEDREFMVLIELLMTQLLELDQIETDGEAKVQRKNEVFIETLDDLRARNHEILRSATPVRIKQELPLLGFGSFAPKPSTVITQHWKLFD